MKFGQALEALLNGRLISRAGWNRNGMVLGLQSPTGVITQPFLYQKAQNGDCTVYAPVQADMLADDWILAPAQPGMADGHATQQAQNENQAQMRRQPETAHAGI